MSRVAPLGKRVRKVRLRPIVWKRHEARTMANPKFEFLIPNSLQVEIDPILRSLPDADRKKPASEICAICCELDGEHLGDPFRGWGGVTDLFVSVEVGAMQRSNSIGQELVHLVEVNRIAFVVELFGAHANLHLPKVRV